MCGCAHASSHNCVCVSASECEHSFVQSEYFSSLFSGESALTVDNRLLSWMGCIHCLSWCRKLPHGLVHLQQSTIVLVPLQPILPLHRCSAHTLSVPESLKEKSASFDAQVLIVPWNSGVQVSCQFREWVHCRLRKCRDYVNVGEITMSRC